MEQNVPSSRRNEEETEEQPEVFTHLNDIIPNISIERIQPLVASFWNRAVSADLTQNNSMEILVAMFLEVIDTIARIILDAFRNMVLEGRAQEIPQLVSEEAVRRAVGLSLCDSVTDLLGFTHQSMNLLFILLTEVTSPNSVLSVLTEEDEVLTELNVPSPRQNEEETEEQAEALSLPNHIIKNDGEVSSATYSFSSSPSPNPNRVLSDLTGEDDVLMEQNLSSPRQNEEEPEEQAEALSPLNHIVKNDGEVSSVTYSFSSSPSPSCVPNDLTEEYVVLMEKNVPSPRQNEEETEKPAETHSPLNYIIKNDGEVSSVTYHPSPNCTPSDLIEGDVVLMENNVPRPRQNEEETEEPAETHSPLNYIIKKYGDVSSVTNRSSHSPNHVPSDLTEEDDVLMEQTVSSPRQNEEETEEQAEALFPLNYIIPKISTEKIQPLVVSFWGRAVSADLTQSKSREILVEMFLVVIGAITSVILDTFRNMVLEGRARENPLLVSEEAVRRAVVPSLCDSFTAALGSNHLSMNTLFTLLSEEVTRHINSVLCSSRVKGECLVMPKESNYRPLNDKMKYMVHNARTMLSSFKNKVRLGCCKTSVMSTELVEEEESFPISSNWRLRETMGRCIPNGGRSQQQKSCDTESDGEVTSVPSNTSDGLEAMPVLWSRDDCNALVCEVVSKIFQKNRHMMPLFKDPLEQLQDNMSDWKVLVKPSRHIYEEVASAVYKDLCKGQKKEYVLHAALFQKDFSSKILDTIQCKLITPYKK